jgi:hypothetical protein
VTEGIETLGPVHADHEHLPVTFSFDDGHVFFSFEVGSIGYRSAQLETFSAHPVRRGSCKHINTPTPAPSRQSPRLVVQQPQLNESHIGELKPVMTPI